MGFAMAGQPAQGRFRGGRVRPRPGRRGAAGRRSARRAVASPRAVAEACPTVILSLPSAKALAEAVGTARRASPPPSAAATVGIECSTLPLADKRAALDVDDGGRQDAARLPAERHGRPGGRQGPRGVRQRRRRPPSSGRGRCSRACRACSATSAPFGNGSIMKYLANLLVTIHNVSAAEAMVLGIKAGLDPSLDLRHAGRQRRHLAHAPGARPPDARRHLRHADRDDPHPSEGPVDHRRLRQGPATARRRSSRPPRRSITRGPRRGARCRTRPAVCAVLEALAGLAPR